MERRLWIVVLVLAAFAVSVQADTVAWWRFEAGPADTQVIKGGDFGATFAPSIPDSSGNGNALAVWDESGAGYAYRTDVGATTIPLTGEPNNLSVVNTGGGPAMFTETGGFLQTWTPLAWTIEVAFQPENGGYRTTVGRDSQGSVTTGDLNLSALYLQTTPDNQLAIKYSDVSGYWHDAISREGLVLGYNWGDDPTGSTGVWQAAAATSDGSTLSLWYRNLEQNGAWELVAQTDLTLSGSPDTRLTAGLGDGSDWDAGVFSVGRGLYAGGHGDRAYGFIDEVRISDAALSVDQFLFVPEPSTLALLGLGGLLAAYRRRR